MSLGATAYTDPSKASDAQKFGMGVSKVNDDVSFLILAGAEHAEDWNHHNTAKTLREIVDWEQ